MDRKEARQFMNDWLWNNRGRTEGLPWYSEYKDDVVSMIVEVTNKSNSTEPTVEADARLNVFFTGFILGTVSITIFISFLL